VWWQLPCDIVAAGSGQHKVEVAERKKKKVTINRRCRLHEWWHGSNCHETLSWQAAGGAKWKWWQKKKKKGNNQPEVWQHEWWHGGTAM